MKDIILPVTCYHLKVGLYLLLGITGILSLILFQYNHNGLLLLYGSLATMVFFVLGFVLLLIAWTEERLPRFPIRCKCDKQ